MRVCCEGARNTAENTRRFVLHTSGYASGILLRIIYIMLNRSCVTKSASTQIQTTHKFRLVIASDYLYRYPRLYTHTL